MKTPWGDTEDLRALRLTPGRGSRGPAAWLAVKRRRFLGALVAGLAEKSYAELTIADLERLSGCGRDEFYRVFESKEDCLLQAVDALYEHALARTAAAYAEVPGPWRRRLAAAFAELVGILADQPDAGRMAVVDAYAAGARGSRRVEVVLERFERLLRRAYAEAGREPLPRALTEAQVAGIQMFAHDRLRRGEEGQLAGAGDQLVAWTLSYETPAARLRASPAEASLPPSATEPEPVERILRAVAELCAEAGVTRLTAQAIAARAHVSLSTLYKHFRGAEAAFLACFIAARDRALAAALAAYHREAEWPAALRAALAGIFAYFAAEPAFARVAMVEVLAAGPDALAARDLALEPFSELLAPGFELAPEAPPIAAELSTFAVYSLVGRHIVCHGAATLPPLLPTATFLALAPFLGSGKAVGVANGDLSAPAAGVSVRT